MGYYKENNKDCVFMYWDSLKYYKEFEEVQALEKSLSKLKDGYVFCRLGEESGDIEFRKRTKIPELMKEFQFIRDIRKKLNEELKEEEEEELKDYEINEKISIENAEEFEKNIQKNINIDNVKYELQDVSKQENKQNINKEETQTKQKIVYTNNKYDVLNMFENKIEMTKDGMSGILELQNNSLDIKTNDSYIEQYKVSLTKKYENVPTNELNDIPKSIEENGVTYYLGNSLLMSLQNIDMPVVKSTGTVIHIATDNKYLGYLIISDVIKKHAKREIANLKKLGIKRILLLSGDDEKVVEGVSKKVGIDEYYAAFDYFKYIEK